MNENQIRELFKTHGVPLVQDDVWKVQGTPVIKHSALERLSAALRLTWDMPVIVRSETDECVVLCRATRTDGIAEWSLGECKVVPMVPTGKKNQYGKDITEPKEGVLGNYQVTPKQAAYPFAMAEKRGKDRVIIKLAGLHGAYSEEEADEFSGREAPALVDDGRANRVEQRTLPAPKANDEPPSPPPPPEDDLRPPQKPTDNPPFDAPETQKEEVDHVARYRKAILACKSIPDLSALVKKAEKWRDGLPANVRNELVKFGRTKFNGLKAAERANTSPETPAADAPVTTPDGGETANDDVGETGVAAE